MDAIPALAAGVVDAMHDGLAILDDCFRLVVWNRAAAAITGWSHEEAALRLDTDLPRGLVALDDATFVDVRRFVVPHAGRGYTAIVFSDANAQVALLQRERSYAEAYERFRRIVDTASQAFVSVDGEGRVTGWNAAAEAMFGWNRAEVMGRTVADIVVPLRGPDGQVESFQRHLSTAGSAPAKRAVVLTALRRDGSELPVELSVRMAPGDDQAELFAFITDVTEQQRAEELLRAARDQALEASRLKSEFLATMSHEIRTPMNAVIGMSDLLLGSGLDADQRELAEVVRGSAQALLALIDDILDFSKISAGKLDLEVVDFDPCSVVEEVAEMLAAPAHARRLEVTAATCRLASPIRGDPARLRQVLVNLVGNAVKFTEEGEVCVASSVAEETAQRVVMRFAVRDTGIGIPPDRQESLFDPFSQADASTTRRYGGTGLGLAICKQLVTLMGGQIGVESAPGRGSTFWFTVPYERARRDDDGGAAPDLGGHRVLVVDDNATSRDALVALLAESGARAESAEDGQRALAMLLDAAARDPFDVALVDALMPEMDGVALVRALAARPELAALKTVMLAPGPERANLRAQVGDAVTACLTKPVRRALLRDTIAALGEDRPPDREPDTAAGAGPARSPAPVVLVVEDNPLNQQVAVRMLERLGCVARVACNGVEGLDALRRSRYDLVLMDCQMPVMDGYVATAELRAAEHDRRTPVVALTAGAMDGDEERCLAAGMDTYLSKPVTLERLRETLARFLDIGPSAGHHPHDP
ncbi:MAG: response regulator [Actinomycetota bacterium]|nr:response regulator [Actinomycetota bacterium]